MSLPWLDRYYCKQENIVIYPVPVHRVTKNGIETIYISSMNNIHDITFNVFTGKKYVDKKHKMEIYDNDIYFN